MRWLFYRSMRFLAMWFVLVLTFLVVQYALNQFLGLAIAFEYVFLLVIVFALMAGGILKQFVWEIISYIGIGLAVLGGLYFLSQMLGYS